MGDDNQKHDRRRYDPERNFFDFVPKNVWGEVYQGRWAELTKVQQVEFIIEVLFLVLFIGGFAYIAYLRGGDLAGLLVAAGVVGGILAIFFFLLTRAIGR